MLTSYAHSYRDFVHCDQPWTVQCSYIQCSLCVKRLLLWYVILISNKHFHDSFIYIATIRM